MLNVLSRLVDAGKSGLARATLRKASEALRQQEEERRERYVAEVTALGNGERDGDGGAKLFDPRVRDRLTRALETAQQMQQRGQLAPVDLWMLDDLSKRIAALAK